MLYFHMKYSDPINWICKYGICAKITNSHFVVCIVFGGVSGIKWLTVYQLMIIMILCPNWFDCVHEFDINNIITKIDNQNLKNWKINTLSLPGFIEAKRNLLTGWLSLRASIFILEELKEMFYAALGAGEMKFARDRVNTEDMIREQTEKFKIRSYII